MENELYYNSNRVEFELENGICDSAGIVEDLHDFICGLIDAAKERQVETELQDFIDAWESE